MIMHVIGVHGWQQTHPISRIFQWQTACEDVICSLNHVSEPVIACPTLDFHMAREC